jgi:hypothetical protein
MLIFNLNIFIILLCGWWFREIEPGSFDFLGAFTEGRAP